MHTYPYLRTVGGRLGWQHEDRWLPIVSGGDGPDTVADSQLIADMNKRLDDLTADLETRNSDIQTLNSEREKARTAAKTTRDALTTDEERSSHDETEKVAESRFAAALAQRVAAFDQTEAEIADFEARIDRERKVEARKADAAKRSPSLTVNTHEFVYRPDSEASYFRDLMCNLNDSAASRFSMTTKEAAGERLSLHAKEMDKVNEERMKRIEARAIEQIHELETRERRSFAGCWQRRNPRSPWASPWNGQTDQRSGKEQRINPNTVDGSGGYFTPPLWAESQWIEYPRAGRVTSDLCKHMDIPPGYASINIPKVSTPTLVAPQGANGYPIVSQDIQDTSVATAFKMLAGQEDVDIQWLDLTPGNITTLVVQSDLDLAFDLCVDQQVVYGNGVASSNAGGLLGIYPTANWTATAVTCTQASPTPANLFGTFGVQLSQIAQQRYTTTNTAFVVHPRRAYWMMYGLDGSSARPFLESSSFAPYNPGAIEEQEVGEGLAFTFPSGHRVYASKNIPATDNGSGVLTGTYDVSIAALFDDLWLFEGPTRVRALEEVLSGTLQYRFQKYGYVGFVQRYGYSVAIAAGNGFAAPTVNGGSF